MICHGTYQIVLSPISNIITNNPGIRRLTKLRTWSWTTHFNRQPTYKLNNRNCINNSEWICRNVHFSSLIIKVRLLLKINTFYLQMDYVHQRWQHHLMQPEAEHRISLRVLPARKMISDQPNVSIEDFKKSSCEALRALEQHLPFFQPSPGKVDSSWERTWWSQSQWSEEWSPNTEEPKKVWLVWLGKERAREDTGKNVRHSHWTQISVSEATGTKLTG